MGSLLKIIMSLLVVQTATAELTNGLYAAFDTSMGSFTCRLDYAEAPLTCANFVGLAEGSQAFISTHGAVVETPFYDGLIFHRVIEGFMIQGGCPLGTGTSGPGYAFPDQISTNLLHSRAGILSMANSGPDSNGSQFFITLDPTTWLDGKHAVFGEVVDGMDTIYDIGNVAVTNGSIPLTNIVMNSVRILRIGSEAEAFNPQDEPLPVVSPLSLAVTNGPAGIEVVAATSNQCEQTIYSSTNLMGWVLSAQQYNQQAENDWFVPAAINFNEEYYRGVRVFYPQATTNEIAGHTLTLTLGTSTIILQPQVSGGACSYNGDSGIITSWDFDSSYCGFMFFTDILVPLSLDFNYVTPTSGIYEGAYYSNGWNPISGTFTDTLLAP